MRTRTLLILAVVCGLAILVAGSIQLLRLTGGDAAATDLTVGQTGTTGDLSVTVDGVSADARFMRVDVTLAGVDDPGGLDSFRLVVPGAALVPLGADLAGPGACTALTVAEQHCQLVFGIADAPGTARVLLVRRGEDQQRWTLA